VREGGYHGETAGSIGSHRNASIDDYIPAIKLITERGGYVIRLGDRSMRPAPKIDGLIDYALSPEKSPAIDIFFCGTSRFVIGTTSGLTTACVSFGTPLVLVNCISNDWQLWSDNTHFIVKPVRDIRNKRFVPFAEVFVPPIQGYLINSQVMRRKGLEPIPNTPEEITEAVRYKLDIVDSLTTPPKDWEEPMRSYIAAMADNPLMFGAARPVPKFLEMRPELLKRTSENSTPA
jgi:putative glycosyltransferase (TIGR04372 family)